MRVTWPVEVCTFLGVSLLLPLTQVLKVSPGRHHVSRFLLGINSTINTQHAHASVWLWPKLFPFKCIYTTCFCLFTFSFCSEFAGFVLS